MAIVYSNAVKHTRMESVVTALGATVSNRHQRPFWGNRGSGDNPTG